MSGHARERAAWFAAALAGAALAMAHPGALPAPLAWIALAVTFAVTPGMWLARRLAPGEPGSARAALAMLLAPFASGVLLVLPRLAGAGAAVTARGLAIVLALLAAWEALRPKGPRSAAPAESWQVAVAALAGAAALALHMLSRPLCERSDGAFHAGVAWAALRALPPEDPFFAGLALRYFWGPHAWAAGWLASAPAVGAYAPFVTSSALALTATLLATGALARRLGASARAAVFAQLLVLTGTAPFAWLLLAARSVSGQVRGAAAWSEALGHGADPALRALDPGTLHPSLVLPLDKFVVLTPFAWGLAGAALVALALVALFETLTWRSAIRLGAVVAAVLFMHPVAGAALALAAIAGLVVAAAGEPGVRAAAARGLVAVGAAALVLAPYVRAVASAGGSQAPLGLGSGVHALLSVVWGGAFLFPAAAVALWRAGVTDTRAGTRTGGAFAHALGEAALARALTAALAVLVLPALVLRLGGDNQSKFLNLAFALAAAPAALAWSRAARTPARRGALAALCATAWAPTLAAMACAYAWQSDGSADAPSRPPAALVSAVRQLVPADAVLVDATQDTTRGAAPAIVGATGRAMLWSGGFMARKWGYRDAALEQRAQAAAALSAGRWPQTAAAAMLDSLAREPWVLAPDDSTRAPDPRWRVVARADGVVLAHFAAP